jgi:hypothetical protein
MNSSTDWDELRRNWRPPEGLERSRPRRVSLTGSGKVVVALAVLLAAAAATAWIALQVIARKQAEEQSLLQTRGVDAEGRVTRLWRSGDKSHQRWVAYEFTAQGRAFAGRSKARKEFWNGLSVGAPLTVRYFPGDPQLNYPSGHPPEQIPSWLPHLIALSLLLTTGLIMWKVRRERWLLEEGRAAPGVVTEHRRTQHGKIYRYEFSLLSGGTARGSGPPGRKPPAIGTAVCVLYDPDNPRRNTPYPLPLVRLARD